MGRSRLLGAILAGLLSSAAMLSPVVAGTASAKEIKVTAQSLAGAYLAAQVAQADNNLGDAIAYYKKALSFDPSNETLKQSLLVVLLSDGRLDEALPIAEDLKNVPQIERFSRLTLAVEAIKNREYRKANTLLKLSTKSDLDRLVTGIMDAWATEGNGHAKEALSMVRKLRGPEWFKLFKSYNSALIADAAGMNAQAEEAYQAAFDDTDGGGASPETYERVIAAYASFKARTASKESALAVLDKGEGFLPNRPTLQALRQTIATGQKPAPLVASPQDGAAEVLYSLGTAINRTGTEVFAKLYLQLSLALRKDNAATLIQLGDIAEKLKNAQEAANFYSQVPAQSPYKAIAEMRLSLNLADLGKNDEAVKHLKALIKASPHDMRTYLLLGGIYSGNKNYADAAANYDDAVAALGTPKREDWSIFYQRGIAYERLKEWNKAEPNFKKALELYPNQPQVLNYLGYSWVDMNMHLDKALDMIRKAVELRPQDGYIVDSLGWAYYKLGRYDQAVDELEKAIQLQPEDPTINDHLGDAYWRVGRKLEATFQWSQARDMKPDAPELAKIEQKLKHGLPPVDDPAVAKDAKPGDPAPAATPDTAPATNGKT